MAFGAYPEETYSQNSPAGERKVHAITAALPCEELELDYMILMMRSFEIGGNAQQGNQLWVAIYHVICYVYGPLAIYMDAQQPDIQCVFVCKGQADDVKSFST